MTKKSPSNQVPHGVCPECFQKKTCFMGAAKKICFDCHQKQPLELRQLSPDFMDEQELDLWKKMSDETKQKHLAKVTKLAQESVGDCSQCQESQTKVIKLWNDKHYCVDCWKYQEEISQSGIATTYRYSQQRCRCGNCQNRRRLSTYSTRELMIETLARRDFEAITTWEDDSFLQRFQELIVELKDTEDFEIKRTAEVNADLFTRNKFSQRKKYSRGV